jgi:hypothetical protein
VKRPAFSGLAGLNPNLGISEDISPEDFFVCFLTTEFLLALRNRLVDVQNSNSNASAKVSLGSSGFEH